MIVVAGSRTLKLKAVIGHGRPATPTGRLDVYSGRHEIC